MTVASIKWNTALRMGQILTGLVVTILLLDAGVLLLAPEILAGSMNATGFPIELSPIIGMILLVSIVLYAIPHTSVMGAILLTAFLGGAICTHFRIGEIGSPPQLVSASLGFAVWAALYLRLESLRQLIPLRDSNRNVLDDQERKCNRNG